LLFYSTLSIGFQYQFNEILHATTVITAISNNHNNLIIDQVGLDDETQINDQVLHPYVTESLAGFQKEAVQFITGEHYLAM
jgi:hypothetical protein